VREMPGNPDIVLPRHKKVIFVNGCFWHGHQDCVRSKRPVTNSNFWNEKIEANIGRDKRNLAALNEMGWQVLVVWGCEIKDTDFLIEKLRNFLIRDIPGVI
jgi:DNA mismatch endonuclease (patch repair protein)